MEGLHVSETVHSYNPANGWLQNNSTPAAEIKVLKGKLPLYGLTEKISEQ
jgi:hypothetical protein